MNCNDCGGFLPHGCECDPMGGRQRRQPTKIEPGSDLTPALLQFNEQGKALMQALADLTCQHRHEFKGHAGREFIDREDAMRNMTRIRDAYLGLANAALPVLHAKGAQPSAETSTLGENDRHEIVFRANSLGELLNLRDALLAAGFKYADGVAAVPAGYKLVPIEPTDEMRRAGVDAYNSNNSAMFFHVWKAMIAAAPSIDGVAPTPEWRVKAAAWLRAKDQPKGTK